MGCRPPREAWRSRFIFPDPRQVREQTGYIREKDIPELHRRGFSVGTHGAPHRKLTFLPKELCIAELTESKRWLEDVIGGEVRYTAAPGGFINSAPSF